MQVTLKLFATFREGRFTIKKKDYPPGITVGQIIEELKIPADKVGILLLNSRHAGTDQPLADGDTLSIFPLVGGG